ncbi:DNA polymerase I [Candidatus Nitrospira nitrificans]|uniref:DNA polymerase I n=1 Tax=Candidatus Nitrospira nitrificans TaxID=1742973 RepID=A0A0S4LFW8_9BACT|nr:DNA polymerase I [Candidatus Nitrospira nitrificans]CUS36481.1 DNA polymerase I [Candidatus Nitrospira nitrificans]
MISLQTDRRPILYLIDGSAYIYRAFFALPALNNSKGLQTNAVYGFTTTLLKIIREHKPDGLAVAFDEKGPTLRHEEFKEYKAQRPPMPDGMKAQIPYIHRVVEALNIPAARQAGYEADDLIGTLARQAEQAGYDVVIVTGDKDMLQLVTSHVRIYDPVKDKWSGNAECVAKFGVEPGRVIEVMGLMGDASDNIPGVKGIGEKTAMKLIAQFGTIDELLRRLDEVTPARIKTLLSEQAENARLSRKLATIDIRSPVEFHPESYRIRPPHEEQLAELLRELEFTSLLKSLQPSPKPSEAATHATVVIEDEPAAKRFVEGLSKGGPLGLHCLLAGQPGVHTDVLGLALSTLNQTAFIPIDVHAYMRTIIELLHDPTHTKTVHDLKSTLLAFHRIGITLAPPYVDTMIADYLLNPNRRDHSLDTIMLERLGERLGSRKQEKAQPQSLFDVDTGSREETAEAAAALAKLEPLLIEQLTDQGSVKLFTEVEMPLVPVLADIERNGFLLDVDGLRGLSQELDRELARMMETIAGAAGGEFNINSPKQLATVLFEKLGLKPLRKTKTGYSTDEDTLTQLAMQHELPNQILGYRSLSKLKSTYVDALPELVHRETKRLHTSLNQTVAATGRLSSTDPNLQNIPVKGDYGLRIREAFIVPKGHELLCADYSQIEPRILAHLSQDPRLLSVFAKGEDIHMATAMEIFGLPSGQITRDMRRAAKTVVFGIVYGISPFGLSQNLGVPQTESKRYIDTFFERFAAVRALMDRNIAEGREKGYTTTILGRRRPIPELQSGDPAQRGFGERMAVNSPIQGSAADLIKVAMINVHKKLRDELPRVKMILQVHDELIFEVPDHDLEEAKRLVKQEMEGVGKRLGLSVPLKVDLGVGKNWRVAHP